tara:strand:- start:295 stop:492 length:198 start_codon:yes stop_codon:yes gene_type:complete
LPQLRQLLPHIRGLEFHHRNLHWLFLIQLCFLVEKYLHRFHQELKLQEQCHKILHLFRLELLKYL